jgi:hypothetical protein
MLAILRNWKNEIQNYKLVDIHGDGNYYIYYLPNGILAILHEYVEMLGYKYSDLAKEMQAYGVETSSADDFRKYIRSQLSPEWQWYYEEDRKNAQNTDDMDSSE